MNEIVGFLFPSRKRGHTIPSSEQKIKRVFLGFFWDIHLACALRAIQSHISIATVILAFYRVWKKEMGFWNHITVLNTSPQNESTTKQCFLLISLTVDVLLYESRLLVFPHFEPLVCLAHVRIPPPLHSFVLFLIGMVCLQPINENMPIKFIEKTYLLYGVHEIRRYPRLSAL